MLNRYAIGFYRESFRQTILVPHQNVKYKVVFGK